MSSEAAFFKGIKINEVLKRDIIYLLEVILEF